MEPTTEALPARSSKARPVAAIEVRYLARVEAFRYLDQIRSEVVLRLPCPEVPHDVGLVSKEPPPHRRRALRRYREETLGAFEVYEQAERTALADLPTLDDDELAVVVEALELGLAEGIEVRERLLAREDWPCSIPGRGHWLVPVARAESALSHELDAA